MLQYLFFDFDGVVINSEPLYQRFWIEACEENGFHLSIEQELNLRSRDHKLTEQYFKELFGEKANYDSIRKARTRRMDEYLKTHQIPLKKGIDEVFKYIKSHTDLKIAIVTSSSPDYVKLHAGYNNVLQYIDDIFSVRNVSRGKPFPDVYLKALEEAHANKEEVIVFEDSPNGVKSAFAAELKVIFMEDLSPADQAIKDMTIHQLNKTIDIIKLIPIFADVK